MRGILIEISANDTDRLNDIVNALHSLTGLMCSADDENVRDLYYLADPHISKLSDLNKEVRSAYYTALKFFEDGDPFGKLALVLEKAEEAQRVFILTQLTLIASHIEQQEMQASLASLAPLPEPEKKQKRAKKAKAKGGKKS